MRSLLLLLLLLLHSFFLHTPTMCHDNNNVSLLRDHCSVALSHDVQKGWTHPQFGKLPSKYILQFHLILVSYVWEPLSAPEREALSVDVKCEWTKK
jgi:hypothetical protein